MTKALFAEIIRHAPIPYFHQSFAQATTCLGEISKRDAKIIARMRATTKFAPMTVHLQDANAFEIEFQPVRSVTGRPSYAEPLRCNCVAVL